MQYVLCIRDSRKSVIFYPERSPWKSEHAEDLYARWLSPTPVPSTLPTIRPLTHERRIKK